MQSDTDAASRNRRLTAARTHGPNFVTLAEFETTLTQSNAPSDASELLQALWWERKGDWDRAHKIIQAQETPLHNRLHAYLHRREGDLDNANYWYRRAGEPMPDGTLEDEWRSLVDRLLA